MGKLAFQGVATSLEGRGSGESTGTPNADSWTYFKFKVGSSGTLNMIWFIAPENLMS